MDFVLLQSYKILTSRAPSYPSDLVRPYVPIGPLHSQGSGVLKVPKVKKTTFLYHALTLWKSLLSDIRLSSSTDTCFLLYVVLGVLLSFCLFMLQLWIMVF